MVWKRLLIVSNPIKILIYHFVPTAFLLVLFRINMEKENLRIIIVVLMIIIITITDSRQGRTPKVSGTRKDFFFFAPGLILFLKKFNNNHNNTFHNKNKKGKNIA